MTERRLRAVDPDVVELRLTIEELAYETGMSVRNIRNHQTRGLLPRPAVLARTGYYGREHVERLRLIQEMQAEGLKLSAIERLLGGESDWAERFVGLRRAVTAPFETEAPEVLTLAELEERFGAAARNPKALVRAQKLGLLINLGDGTFEAPTPSLLDAAQHLVDRGVPPMAMLAAIDKARRNTQATAEAFVELFMNELWKPFDEAGQPDAGWDELTESIERLPPLAAEVLLSLFKPALAREIEKAFGKALEAQAKRRR